jgi:inorganic pyrophosphatase
VLIDRPLGSKHPELGFHYPVNYGFLPGTRSADGEPIDVYILGLDKPVRMFEGYAIAVLERAEEDDPKMIVVPRGRSFTDEEILSATHFQEQHYTVTLRRRKR